MREEVKEVDEEHEVGSCEKGIGGPEKVTVMGTTPMEVGRHGKEEGSSSLGRRAPATRQFS
jgi:hypothetical protein